MDARVSTHCRARSRLPPSPQLPTPFTDTEQGRENLHSKICEGLRAHVRDVSHQADWIHLRNEVTTHPIDLTSEVLKTRTRRCGGGLIVREVNSNRDGKYWDDAKRRLARSRSGAEGLGGGNAVREEARRV